MSKAEFLKVLKKEWKAHRENITKSEMWFECTNTENEGMNNYAVGTTIHTTFSNGEEKTIVLSTKKQAEEYSKKEKASYGKCIICSRFERLLRALESEKE